MTRRPHGGSRPLRPASHMNRPTSFLLVFCVGLASYGCIEPSGFTKVASIEGRWTGRVVAVTAVDARGNSIPAAALKLTAGPTWVLREDLGGGREPLLVQGPPKEYVLIDPGTLPVGRRVEVEGKTIVLYAASWPAPDRVTRTRRPEGDSRNEHVLVVHRIHTLD